MARSTDSLEDLPEEVGALLVQFIEAIRADERERVAYEARRDAENAAMRELRLKRGEASPEKGV